MAFEPLEGTPVVRVWLDGTREPAQVADEVTAMLGGSSRSAEMGRGDRSPARRAGLGRGLDALLAKPEPSAAPGEDLESITVIEHEHGLRVRAAGSDGRRADADAVPGSEHVAVAHAVAALAGCDAPDSVAVDARSVGDATVVTVVVGLSDGTRAAGAAIASGGMPYAIGKAVWAALASARDTPG